MRLRNSIHLVSVEIPQVAQVAESGRHPAVPSNLKLCPFFLSLLEKIKTIFSPSSFLFSFSLFLFFGMAINRKRSC